MNNISMDSEPPVKKQKTHKGTGNATAVRDGSDPTLKRKDNIVHSEQYKMKNYRGALQEYFQKKGGQMPSFTAVEKSEPRALKKIFEATCKAGDLEGTGEAGTKKAAYQLSALDAIQKMGLIPAGEFKPTKLGDQKLQVQAPPVGTKKKEKLKMVENKQYLTGNFRGALQEHFARSHPGVRVVFDTKVKEGSSAKRFIATCKTVGSTDEKFTDMEAIGNAPSKKIAIRQSALQFILKMNLITPAQHSEIHHENVEITNA